MSQRPTPQRRRAAVIQAGDAQAGTVVVGLDGSAPSWGAFWWAAGAARRSGRRIIAVFVSRTHVNEAISAASGMWTDQGAVWQATERRAAELEEIATKAAQELGLDLRFIHAQGDAASELLEVARYTFADLIVVGRSANPVRRLVGSIGKRLASSRRSPVVVIVP
jgi:nucleotide-binding universal stress UspA family protein